MSPVERPVWCGHDASNRLDRFAALRGHPVEAARANDMRSGVTCCVAFRGTKVANGYVSETKVLQILEASITQIRR